MTQSEHDADRLRRIIRVLTNWIEAGEMKGKKGQMRFVYKMSNPDRERTAERIEVLKKELKETELHNNNNV